MTTSIRLKNAEKNAENSSGRPGNGESVSARTWRGTRRFGKLVFAFLVSASGWYADRAFAQDANGTITAVNIHTVPEPVDGGWYELGVASYQKNADEFDSRNAMGVGYINWTALQSAGLPAGAKIRFVGGVALDNLPDGYDYDFSTMKNVAVLNPDVVFAKMAVPAGCVAIAVQKHPYTNPNPAISADGETATITWSLNNLEINVPVINNGTIVAGTGSNNNHIYNKGVTGSGTCRMNGAYHWLKFTGVLNFPEGTIYHKSDTDDHRVVTATSDDAPAFGKYNPWTYSGKMAYLLYDPVNRETPGTLCIKNFAPSSSYVSGLEKSGVRRRGLQLCVCSGNTLQLEKPILGTGKSLGLFAGTAPGYTVGNPPAFNQGFGTVVLGNDTGTDDQFEPDNLFVSPQMNVVLKKYVTRYVYGTHHFTVNYTVESNVVNKAVLDASGHNTSNWYGDGQSDTKYALRAVGYAPYNLPRTITVPNVQKALNHSFVNVLDTEWTVPFDFGASDPNEINPTRCETDCKLEIPESGTVYVRNDTVANGNAVYPEKKTLYPILTCSAGGEAAFANWNVRFTGDWSRCRAKKVVKDTGLYIEVVCLKGLAIIFR